MITFRPILTIVLLLLIISCDDDGIDEDKNRDVFEMNVSREQEKDIVSSRGSSVILKTKNLELMYNGIPAEVKQMKTRGNSALMFKRKSYSVSLKQAILIHHHDGLKSKMLSKFKLLALAQDYTYIENRIAFGILEDAGVFPLIYKYVELRLNGRSQGIYLLVEDPEEYSQDQGSEYILRRGYNHKIDDSNYKKQIHKRSETEYEDRFLEIYTLIKKLKGKELYDMVSERINLEQYFLKMAIDFLLKNGDYTDEVFLYSLIVQENIQYHLIPWDYDDIFADVPHEAKIAWGMGKIFGERQYNSEADIREVLGDKLVYSIEDDLDYIIATDPYFYSQYEIIVRGFFGTLEDQYLDKLISRIQNELYPFYMNKELVKMSKSDQKRTSMRRLGKNMRDKHLFLQERLPLLQ